MTVALCWMVMVLANASNAAEDLVADFLTNNQAGNTNFQINCHRSSSCYYAVVVVKWRKMWNTVMNLLFGLCGVRNRRRRRCRLLLLWCIEM